MDYFEQHLLPEERNSIPYLPTTVHLIDFVSKQYAGHENNQSISAIHHAAGPHHHQARAICKECQHENYSRKVRGISMEEKLMTLLMEVSPDIDPKQISSKSYLRSDLGLDSLKCMMLLMGIEEAFHIELDESAIFEKVEDVYKYLQSHGAK